MNNIDLRTPEFQEFIKWASSRMEYIAALHEQGMEKQAGILDGILRGTVRAARAGAKAAERLGLKGDAAGQYALEHLNGAIKRISKGRFNSVDDVQKHSDELMERLNRYRSKGIVAGSGRGVGTSPDWARNPLSGEEFEQAVRYRTPQIGDKKRALRHTHSQIKNTKALADKLPIADQLRIFTRENPLTALGIGTGATTLTGGVAGGALMSGSGYDDGVQAGSTAAVEQIRPYIDSLISAYQNNGNFFNRLLNVFSPSTITPSIPGRMI